MKKNIFQYCGAIHIHTKFSDGTGDIQSISKAAKKAGLDWIIVTDHNSMEIEEGIFNGVYVIKAEEISPAGENHYLAFGIKEVILPSDNPQEYVDKVREYGGFGFAAHPDEGYTVDENGKIVPRKNSYHCIPWSDKSIKPDGVEIWNWFSNWADNLNDKTIFHLAYSYFFKHKTVKSPSKLTLDWWDKLNSETAKIIPALGGVDAHALRTKDYLIPLTIFPYETCFKTVNNIINIREPLSKDFKEAKSQILSAIKCGNNIIINKKIQNYAPEVFINNDKDFAYCGEDIILTENTNLNIRFCKKICIKIFLNGREIYKERTHKIILPIKETGKYRIEFLYKEKGFAYTNPIVVK